MQLSLINTDERKNKIKGKRKEKDEPGGKEKQLFGRVRRKEEWGSVSPALSFHFSFSAETNVPYISIKKR